MMKIAALAMVLLAAVPRAPAAAATDAEELFTRRCAGCHGAMGNGRTPVGRAKQLRNLASPEVQQRSDDELTRIIAEGAPSKKAAHAWKRKGLTDEQIASLVAWIRTLKE